MGKKFTGGTVGTYFDTGADALIAFREREVEKQEAFVHSLYDSLIEEPVEDGFRVFRLEYYTYGMIIAVYNLGFMTGRK